MNGMFGNCISFNQPLNDWNTSSVTNMTGMFMNCKAFNGDIKGWNTSNVTDISNMFIDCEAFNGDIKGWNTSSVVNMNNMFLGCRDFNQDLSSWNVSSVETMQDMFKGCENTIKIKKAVKSWMYNDYINENNPIHSMNKDLTSIYAYLGIIREKSHDICASLKSTIIGLVAQQVTHNCPKPSTS
jgi:surface protein